MVSTNFKDWVGKKLHCEKSKQKLTNVSAGHSKQPLCTWGIWQEKPAGECAGAHTAWPCGTLAAQERVWCGCWGIGGRFSAANSAVDLLHELRELI